MSRLRVLCPDCDAVLRPKTGALPRGIARCPRCGADVPLRFSQPGGPGLRVWIAAGAVAGVIAVGLVIWLVVAATRGRPAQHDPAVADNSPPAAAPSPLEELTLFGRDPGNPEQPMTAIVDPAAAPTAGQGSVTAPGGIEILEEGVPPLRYRWQPGQRYGYEITIVSRVEGLQDTLRGTCVYTPQPLAPGDSGIDEEQGSGTGFVVHSDGVLVTCAHVVQDATQIEVTLGTQTYPAEVLAFDRQRDIAVLRIPARGLHVLPLGDSDRVELAQEVRAVGYPLSDILGDNVKITRGTISGINSGEAGRILQIDAAINPGNSGGPLVDESGRVVGVASSKLTGLEVSGVGFGVPSNEVKRILAQKGFTFQTAGPATLTGPELARRVTPAIALVKVTTGPGGVGAVERYKLAYEASYSSSRFGSERESGTAIVDACGEILAHEGEKQLPLLQGPLGVFVLSPLSPSGGRTWDETSRISITRIESAGESDFGWQSPFGRRPFGGPRVPNFPRGPRGRFGPFGGSEPDDPKVTVLTGTEQTTFTLEDAAQPVPGAAAGQATTLVPIRRTYELTTDETAAGRPVLKMTGEGTLHFDTVAGIPDHLAFTATLHRQSDDGSSTATLEIAFRRLEAEELAPDGGLVPNYQPAAAPPPARRGRLPMYRPRGR